MTRKVILCLVFFLVLFLGYNKLDNEDNNQDKNQSVDNQDESSFPPLSIKKEWIHTDKQGVGLGSFCDSCESAYMKSTKERMGFTQYGRETYWLRLNNDSEKKIIVTEAYITVQEYETVNYGDYVISLVGDGDYFDPILNLKSEVGSNTQDHYWAYEDDNYKDSVINVEIPSNDGININYDIQFITPGIYNYTINIEYIFENEIYTISEECGETMYDNINDQEYTKALDEFDPDEYF